MPPKKRKVVARKRKAPVRRRRAAVPQLVAIPDQMGGINFGAILQGINKVAKVIKPATLLGQALKATGADKGKVGRHFATAARLGQQFGYARPMVMYPTPQYRF